jgi:hypothetical protein
MIYFADEEGLVKQLEKSKSNDYANWIRFKLADSTDYEKFVGTEENMYTLKVSKYYPYWEYSLFDFIGYEESYNKDIILDVSKEEYEQAKKKYGMSQFNDKCLRNDEPEVLTHSTPWASWQNIQSDQCLKSWNVLKQENADFESEPIGKQLGDPENYRDYIMLGKGHIAEEIVVLSKQNGYIDMDPEKEYQPGAKLYFDAKAIAEDGLLIRDGAHLKVKNELSLEKYLIWVATWESVQLVSQFSTPLEFTTIANQMFNELHGEKYNFTLM